MPAADQDRMRQRHIETALEAIDVWYDPESGPYERTEPGLFTEICEFVKQKPVSSRRYRHLVDLSRRNGGTPHG